MASLQPSDHLRPGYLGPRTIASQVAGGGEGRQQACGTGQRWGACCSARGAKGRWALPGRPSLQHSQCVGMGDGCHLSGQYGWLEAR